MDKKIDRPNLVGSYNPVLTGVDVESPLSIGNSSFSFTCDPTGLQSLYDVYRDAHIPLCTMAGWAWHTSPAPTPSGIYTYNDLDMDELPYRDRMVLHAVHKTGRTGHVYDWLRMNPHRYNLGRIGFLLDGKPLHLDDVASIHQELDLYRGRLTSSFTLNGCPCEVRTAVHGQASVLGIEVDSALLDSGRLTVCLAFPYGSPDISGSDWDQLQAHTTTDLSNNDGRLVLSRVMDTMVSYVAVTSETAMTITVPGVHHYVLAFPGMKSASISVEFSPELPVNIWRTADIFASAALEWQSYWEQGGMVDFSACTDPRAQELGRRVILSLYLQAINSSDSFPPQETGLFCNSWYGKSHLEMYPWHCMAPILWQRASRISGSLEWYRNHVAEARNGAMRNHFKGTRWPKMIGPSGIDSPSPIATLLAWQQPHIIFMLEMYYRSHKDQGILAAYWGVIQGTADYMVDIVVENPDTGRYDLTAPIIPVQEEFKPMEVLNPAFEVEYWVVGLEIAGEWARRLGMPVPARWKDVASRMAPAPHDGIHYLAHSLCPATFEDFNRDHPSMLGSLGYLPGSRIDAVMMARTLDKVLEVWEFPTMWGWDFALMALTATRLGKPDLAVDLLLRPEIKNTYVASGHNFQRGRTDLPVYMPGNGGLLWAVAVMCAGYDGCTDETPGFPKDGTWNVIWENLSPLY